MSNDDRETPFVLPEPEVLTRRDVEVWRGGQRRGLVRLEMGRPYQFGNDPEWICLWQIVRPTSPAELISKGVSVGSDELQAIVRSLQVIRTTLETFGVGDGVELRWDTSTYAGIPSIGPETS